MMRLFRNLQFFFRGIRVFALVGKSGTGKSFRARLVAEKHNIDLMIDDGLLIRGQQILAGRSAKREPAYLKAVKTALFTDKEHRKQIVKALERESFKRILIIGTSERMVNKITKNLGLPPPTKVISIEDVATADEIATAIHMRRSQGRHVIPVPAIEVKRNYSGIVAESLKVFLRRPFRLFNRQRVYEKSVVRPEFGRRGQVAISEAALSQMILHCVQEFGISAEVKKLQVRTEPAGYRITVVLDLPYGIDMAHMVHQLQSYIVDHIERYTGVMIDELNVVVDSVSPRRKGHDEQKERHRRKRSQSATPDAQEAAHGNRNASRTGEPDGETEASLHHTGSDQSQHSSARKGQRSRKQPPLSGVEVSPRPESGSPVEDSRTEGRAPAGSAERPARRRRGSRHRPSTPLDDDQTPVQR